MKEFVLWMLSFMAAYGFIKLSELVWNWVLWRLDRKYVMVISIMKTADGAIGKSRSDRIIGSGTALTMCKQLERTAAAIRKQVEERTASSKA